MRTLFLLIPLVFSSLFNPAGARGGQPSWQNDPSGGERCITDKTVTEFPWVYEAGRDFVECLNVQDVTATFSHTVPVQVTLRVTGQRWEQMDYEGTEMEVRQGHDGGKLVITIYRHVSAVMSAATPADSEITIPLEGRFEAGSYAVQINNYALEIAIPNAPPPGSDVPPPQEPYQRHAATIFNVDAILSESYPVRLSLRVTGYFDAGCTLPPDIEHQRIGRQINVDISCLFDPEGRTSYTPLDQVIRIEGSFERGTYTVQVNDFAQEIQIPFPPPPPPVPIRRYAVIDNVEVLVQQEERAPVQLTLHVTGSISESCQGPLQINSWHAGDQIRVELYVEVNPALMCPDRLMRVDEYIPLDGYFQSGWYTITVNDYILHTHL